MAPNAGRSQPPDIPDMGDLLKQAQKMQQQLLGPHSLDRVDGALEHVVPAAELLGLLDRDDVARLLHDADERGVTALVETQAAQLALGDVVAARAERDAVLHLVDGMGEPLRVLLG